MATKEICFACHSELVPVMPNISARRRDDEPDFKDSLRIRFSGGYGMFFDDEPKTVIICNDCAIELFHRVPWVESVLEI